jgi:hypothetical protein
VNIDYILLIQVPDDGPDCSELAAKLRNIDGVTAVFNISRITIPADLLDQVLD